VEEEYLHEVVCIMAGRLSRPRPRSLRPPSSRPSNLPLPAHSGVRQWPASKRAGSPNLNGSVHSTFSRSSASMLNRCSSDQNILPSISSIFSGQRLWYFCSSLGTVPLATLTLVFEFPCLYLRFKVENHRRRPGRGSLRRFCHRPRPLPIEQEAPLTKQHGHPYILCRSLVAIRPTRTP